jgi:ElaB/YqjD/DUF883 family membrane-anchored ribosome-binding protein
MPFRMKRNRNQTEARLQALKGDFEVLQRDMRLLLDSIGTEAGERVAKATNGAAHQVEEWANDGVESVRETIRAQPLAAIALSMSAGAVFSSLLRR